MARTLGLSPDEGGRRAYVQIGNGEHAPTLTLTLTYLTPPRVSCRSPPHVHAADASAPVGSITLPTQCSAMGDFMGGMGLQPADVSPIEAMAGGELREGKINDDRVGARLDRFRSALDPVKKNNYMALHS